MSIVNHAKNEFKLAGWMDSDGNYTDEIQGAMCKDILEVLEVISKQGHSGSTIGYLLSRVNALANFETLTPLHGGDDEWMDISEQSGYTLYQNMRMPTVFKRINDDGEEDIYDLDRTIFYNLHRCEETGKIFRSYFTNKNSIGKVTFPYTRPEPIYLFEPTEEFPEDLSGL